MNTVASALVILVAVATAMAWLSALVLAFYLDLRRSTLVGAGQLPRSTPELYVTNPNVMARVIGLRPPLNWRYIASPAFSEHPDMATRWWAPVLRGLLMAAKALTLLTLAAVALKAVMVFA